MKRYITPICRIVNINPADIVTASVQNIITDNVSLFYGGGSTDAARAPGRSLYEDVIYLGY